MDYFRTSDGFRIAYAIDDFNDPWKDAEPLVLLHPAMGSMRRYYSWIPHLARDYRVIRQDTRGHGLSDIPPPESRLDIDRLTLDTIELLDHLRIERAHICGCSAGGYVAQRLAMRHPERVRSIALYASTPGLYTHDAAAWIPRIQSEGLRNFLADTISDRYDLGRVDPGLVRWFLSEATKNDVAYVARFVLTMTKLNMSDDLGQIRCPTLIVYPGGETVGSTSDYQEMQRRIPDCELVVYEGYAHNINDAAADRCAQDLLTFLKKRFPAKVPVAR